MHPHPRWVGILLLLVAISCVRAQTPDTLISRSDTLLTYADSLSIFNLIDSLLQLDSNSFRSQFAARLGYNSNVLSAGQTLGIQNFGLSPGFSYYHKSGFFADVMAYWSANFDPKLYLMTLTGGYLHVFTQKFSLIAAYNRYIYLHTSAADYIPYANSVSVSPDLEIKPLAFRLDYSFYFGDENVHRIMPGISLRLTRKNFLRLTRVSLYPTINMMWGNEHYTELVLPSTDAEIQDAIQKLEQGLPWYNLIDHNEFGVLNYSFSLPLSLTLKNLNLYISYSYSIPRSLPGEPFTLDNSSFVSASFSWYFNAKGK